jgi:hypothetical protein
MGAITPLKFHLFGNMNLSATIPGRDFARKTLAQQQHTGKMMQNRKAVRDQLTESIGFAPKGRRARLAMCYAATLYPNTHALQIQTLWDGYTRLVAFTSSSSTTRL